MMSFTMGWSTVLFASAWRADLESEHRPIMNCVVSESKANLAAVRIAINSAVYIEAVSSSRSLQ